MGNYKFCKFCEMENGNNLNFCKSCNNDRFWTRPNIRIPEVKFKMIDHPTTFENRPEWNKNGTLP